MRILGRVSQSIEAEQSAWGSMLIDRATQQLKYCGRMTLVGTWEIFDAIVQIYNRLNRWT